MSTRELLKQEIDTLPDSALDDLRRVIDTRRSRKRKIKVPPTPLDLGGRFDNVDIRKLAYEE